MENYSHLQELGKEFKKLKDGFYNFEKKFSVYFEAEKNDKQKERKSNLKKIEEEIKSETPSDIMKEIPKERCKTGTKRLDDLLYGGLPVRSNVLVYGPPFTGKQVLLNIFIAEGLKNSIPAIYITTDKTSFEAKENLKLILPNIEKYEEKDLIKFIDAYSASMGIKDKTGKTECINDLKEINPCVEMAMEAHKKHGKNQYRLALDSVSNLFIENDFYNVWKVLKNLACRCKQNNATALYTMENMLPNEEVNAVKHIMSGAIETKVDDLNTFLRIEGITDVRARAWIQYAHDSRSITIKGSWSVDQIR